MSVPPRPLNIAIFSDSALPILNGVSVSIDALIEGLRASGHSVHLFTSGFPGHKDQDPNVHRFFATKTPFAPGYPLSLPPFYPLLREFREQTFDIVHTHTPFTIGFVGLRWAESHNIPLVTTYHTLYDKYTHYIPLFPNRFLKYKIAKHTNYYYNRVRHIITPSKFSREWLSRHQIRRPITVIPTGVPKPVDFPRNTARELLNTSTDHFVALYCGRLAVEKNLDILIKSMALIMGEQPNLRLWIVGDGPAREQYRRLARELGIGDRVKFWGFIDRNKIGLYYSAANLFVFASQTETQGLVIQEAMSFGLPTVVVEGGGADDTVISGKNGIITQNSVDEFARAANSIINNPHQAQQMSECAFATYQDHTITSMVNKTISVYNQTLGIEEIEPNHVH